MDFIQGSKFIQLVDSIYSPKSMEKDDHDKYLCTVNWEELKDINILYTLTPYAPQLLDIIQYLKEKFIIISHNSDCRIEEQGVVIPDGRSYEGTVIPYNIPDNVLKWYSSNVNLKHFKVTSIPIGVENKKWQGNPSKKEQMIAKATEPREYKNLLYMNHSIGTNVKQRLEPYRLFEGRPWVTSHRGKNGLSFDVYIDNIYNHKFMICPEGNGIDTHRTWECLYMGTIPIEKRNINNQFYTDLPICFVDNWDEVTKKFLDKEYKRIKNSVWNLDKLNFKYWKGLINPLQSVENNLAMRIKKGKVLIQIGTNNGADEFNTIAKWAEASRVILVEPLISHNIAIRNHYAGINNVFIENVAITEVNKGLVKVVTPKDNPRNYSLLPMDDWGDDFLSIETPSMTFNELCEKYGITDVHYLQIDTEGYDVEILKAIDFKKINIDIIKYENWRFPEDCFKRYGDKSKLYGLNSIRAATVLLEGLGYKVRTDWGDDSVAIKN